MISIDQIIDAVRSAKGSVTGAARLLGCTAPALFYRIRRNPDLRACVNEIRATAAAEAPR